MNEQQAIKVDVLPTLDDIRRMPDAELLAYAERIGDDEAAWDEISERGCDRQFDEVAA